MSIVRWRPWVSGAAHTSRSSVDLSSKLKRGGGESFHETHVEVSGLPYAGENVVPIWMNAEQRGRRRENVNGGKKGETGFWTETVIPPFGSGLRSSTFVDTVATGKSSLWKRKALKRDLVKTEIEVSSSNVQENEIFADEAKFWEDHKILGESIYGSWENKRHAGCIARRSAMLAACSAVFSSVHCSCCSKAVAQDSSLEWDYGSPSGVGKWQGLCAVGSKQSPINIPLSKAKSGESLGELQFDYGSSSPVIVNPGHGTMQVSFAQGKNILGVGGRDFELLQFHFHAPSEHAFDGERFAMEAHLVHRDMKTKALAVVGIMLDANDVALPNEGLAESLAYAPAEHGQSVHVQHVSFSPSLLLPLLTGNAKRRYVHYVGSLSTPPCSEGVDWFLLENSVKIPTAQVLEFLRFAGDRHSLAFNSEHSFILQSSLVAVQLQQGPTEKSVALNASPSQNTEEDSTPRQFQSAFQNFAAIQTIDFGLLIDEALERPLQPLGNRVVYKGPE